jgi:hypothetical protein
MPRGRLRTEPGQVTLVIHEAIQPPVIAQPTVHDAKAFAARIHDIVASTVEARTRGQVEIVRR